MTNRTSMYCIKLPKTVYPKCVAINSASAKQPHQKRSVLDPKEEPYKNANAPLLALHFDLDELILLGGKFKPLRLSPLSFRPTRRRFVSLSVSLSPSSELARISATPSDG